MTQYTLGFAFYVDGRGDRHVVLIKKTKPDWQEGKLNGLGGKIEHTETSTEAMAREFAEESGCFTSAPQWRLFCRLESSGAEIFCFATALSERQLACVEPMAGEDPVEIVPMDELPSRRTIYNLDWLLQMACAALSESELHPFYVVKENTP